MIVALGGMFRNSTRYLPRYFSQVTALDHALASRGDSLRLVLAEGDSVDGTWEELAKYTRRRDAVLVKRTHYGPYWGSEDNPARWRALSWVCNGILDHVSQDVDRFLYVETDLAWTAETMIALLDQLSYDRPAMSPMCFTQVGDFYDIWGHIKDGVAFSPFPPYHEALNGHPVEVDSTGSCVSMLGEVARAVRYGPDDLVRGLGRSIREQGYSLWVDPSLRVVHL